VIEDRDVNAKTAAELFGIPIGWIYQWRREGQLTPSQIFKSRGRTGEESFYKLSAIARLVADHHERRHAAR
jgi:predicted site-specific integrase-resolvase